MQKIFAVTLKTAAIALLALGTLRAQDAPAPKPKPAAPSTTPKTQKTPAASSAATPKTGTTAKTGAPLVLKTQKDKVSYAIGLNIGKSFRKDSVDVNSVIFARGVKDAITGAKPLLTDEELKAALTELQAELKKHQDDATRVAGETNQKAGETFLAENKTKDGVVALPSGLQYKIITAGTGPKPAETDSVVCNYRGTLLGRHGIRQLLQARSTRHLPGQWRH